MFIDKNGVVRRPVVYLADFEMFLPTCEETVAYWKKTCEKYGFIGLFPGEGDPVEPGEDFWKRVFLHDYDHMKNCDMCIAQLDDWRGHECDSGTAFELGWYIAKGMPAYGFYGGKSPLKERNIEKDEHDLSFDKDGYMIEDKEYPFENMFTLVKIGKDFEEACRLAREDFDAILVENGYEPYAVE